MGYIIKRDLNFIKRILLEELWSWYQVMFMWIPGRFGHRVRGLAIGCFMEYKGQALEVKENVEIWHPFNLSVGSGCGIGRNNILNCTGKIKLGDNVRLGPNVMITTVNHATSRGGMVNQQREIKDISIGNNTWIGNHVTIVAGVTLGDNCIVAAGSVVTRSFGSNSILVGVPARQMSEVNEL